MHTEINKILFVSDLDGTLLNTDKSISNHSLKLLNNLINKGINFTIATARTPATVTIILNKLNIALPIICMNGSAIYDIKNREYIKYLSLNNFIVDDIIKESSNLNINCFVYTILKNHLNVYYNKIMNNAEENFYNERKNLKLKTFINKIHNLNNKSVFIMFLSEIENINKIRRIIESKDYINRLSITQYEDIYYKGYYYLEIYNNEASKGNGIQFLKKENDINKIIVFGDNLNDMSMFETADEAYAVKNAANDIKTKATAVIEENNNNAVAEFINNYVNKNYSSLKK